MKYVIIHYHEIGLKGKNRSYFENLLMKNIKFKLGKLMKSCLRESGQIVLEVSSDVAKIKDIVSRIPGVAYFSFAKRCKLDINLIKKEVIVLLKNKKYKTFKIDTKRRDKRFEYSSMEVDSLLGEKVVKKYNKKVKLKDPDITVKIEISSKYAYISSEDIDGVGGLPTDPRQKVVALLSGGFDSPVAAFMMMKRGCEVILVHFQNRNQMTKSVNDKIVQLAKQLSKFQIKTRLHIVPFEDIQKEIIMKVPSRIRMLVYRRFMILIASEFAKLSKARFLVVGDSLSQVASQTLDNLEATYYGSEKHILSPLIGMDKKDIIDISKKIGTFEISSMPYGDCCSYFVAKHPELRADAKMLVDHEKKFDFKKLTKKAIEKAKITEIS